MKILSVPVKKYKKLDNKLFPLCAILQETKFALNILSMIVGLNTSYLQVLLTSSQFFSCF